MVTVYADYIAPLFDTYVPLPEVSCLLRIDILSNIDRSLLQQSELDNQSL